MSILGIANTTCFIKQKARDVLDLFLTYIANKAITLLHLARRQPAPCRWQVLYGIFLTSSSSV